MRTRFRTWAALLALLAFSASFAEQVWASACAPAVAEHAAPHSAVDGGHGAAHLPDAPGHHRAPDGGCPLQAVAGGCVLFSSPAPVRDAAPAADAPRVVISPRSDSSRELLLAAGFFRPPRA